jgi:F-type H+/Na+-transporting ATPase subunit beta
VKVVPIIRHVVDIAASPGIVSVDVTVSQAIRVQGVTCEVQQLLGEGTIRCVAMEATEGLKRGEPAIGLGGPIAVPVGRATLGRIFKCPRSTSRREG